MLSLPLTPRPSHGIMVDTDMLGLTMVDTTTARGLLMLSLLLMPRLNHGIMVDTDGHTMEDITTMARGLLMLSPLLMPKLNPGIMLDMDTDGHPMEDTGGARSRVRKIHTD